MKFESELAKSVFESKYLLEGETTADEAVERVVKSVAKVYPEIGDEARDYIHKQWFIPAGGIWRAAGNPSKNVSHINCTTLGYVEDNLESIFDSVYKWAKYASAGQGEGIDISKLRPRGAKVHNSSRSSTGAVSFMYVFDAVLKIIAQQGRRGASLISIADNHPDIEEFISIKDKPESDKSRIDTANISIQATDAFMKAIEDDADWTLTFENKYEKIEKTVKARDLFNKICEMAWKRGDPGLQFIDTWRRYSNSDQLGYPLEASNACQPRWAKVLTPEGIREFGDIEVGSLIWSKEGWTKVVNKWSTGVKEVYKFETTSSIFYGTENHRVISDGEKVEVKDANSIESLRGIFTTDYTIDPQDVMDGLVIGDGSVHKASNNLVFLCIGEKDKDYFNSEVKNLIVKHRPGISNYAYEISTTISYKELPHTYDREVPKKFIDSPNKAVGFLRGIFSANGSIAGNRVTLKASSKKIIEDVQLMLNSLGIRSYYTINKSTSIKFSNGTYTSRQSYDLNITSDREKFAKIIGFIQNYKNESLKIVSTRSIKEDYDIISRELISEEEVFEITVDNPSHTYWTQGCNVSNCGEIPNSKYNVCNLSHINLAKFNEYKEEGYRNLISFGVKFLNAIRINEINEERSPVEEQRVINIDNPRIGLGVSGLADYFIDNKIRYGSDESITKTKYLFSILAQESYKEGYRLAKKYGSFPSYDKEKMKKSKFIQNLLNSGMITDSELDYQFNVAYNAVAPVGTGALISNNGGSGIEPLFSRYMVRRERSTTNDWKEWFTFNAYVERYLKEHGMEVTKENADKLTDDYWVMSYDVDALQKVKLVSEAQKWIDNAISITFNLPEDVTIEAIQKVYMEAWKHELKGVTVYREGSLAGVLITEKSYNKQLEEKAKSEKKHDDDYAKRPDSLPCDIYETTYKGQKFVTLVGLNDGEPYEVFVSPNDGSIEIEKYKKGKIVKVKSGHYDLIVENGITKTMVNDIGKTFDSMYGTLSRMVSMSLRHKVPLQFIVDQLNKDSNIVGFEKTLSRVLKKYIKEGTVLRKVCPECGSTLVFQDGCIGCPSCGYSKCD